MVGLRNLIVEVGRGLFRYEFWVLLSQAVECSQAPDKIDSGNADDLVMRKQILQHLHRNVVRRIIKGGNDDASVADVEIAVTRWQSMPLLKFWRWYSEFMDRQSSIVTSL